MPFRISKQVLIISFSFFLISGSRKYTLRHHRCETHNPLFFLGYQSGRSLVHLTVFKTSTKLLSFHSSPPVSNMDNSVASQPPSTGEHRIIYSFAGYHSGRSAVHFLLKIYEVNSPLCPLLGSRYRWLDMANLYGSP